MVKLERNYTPIFFSPKNVAILTADFKNNNTSVWQEDEVKTPLLALSKRKCAYCEIKLNEKSTYLEVEHFKDKSTYPDDVIKWENLLPSCKRCNVHKSTHDVVQEPIINPCDITPSQHLFLKNYRIKGKTELGKMTISVLSLNDYEHLVMPRCEVGAILEDKLENALEYIEEYAEKPHHARKRKIIGLIRGILKECQGTAIFSAISSTKVHSSDEYQKLHAGMLHLKLWEDSLETLHEQSKRIQLV